MYLCSQAPEDIYSVLCSVTSNLIKGKPATLRMHLEDLVVAVCVFHNISSNHLIPSEHTYRCLLEWICVNSESYLRFQETLTGH